MSHLWWKTAVQFYVGGLDDTWLFKVPLRIIQELMVTVIDVNRWSVLVVRDSRDTPK